MLKGVGATGAGLFIASVGVAAPAAASEPVPAALPRIYARTLGEPSSSVDFRRIFPRLRPLADPDDEMRAALPEVGTRAGS